MTILNKIIAKKREEVMTLQKETFHTITTNKRVNTFAHIARKKKTMNIIAEFKRASPSKGMIRDGLDPVEQAKLYERYGASAISVLTDTPFFHGTMEDLQRVREAVNLPILCKDFMIDPIQIDRAKAAGASIILLIAAALNDEELQRLYEYAKERDVEVLCEVNNEREMERVLQLGAELIGINNRDLKTFHVDLTTTEKLARLAKLENVILVSESGLRTKEDVETVARFGARAILVGETFMTADNPAEIIEAFQIPLQNEVTF